MEKDYKKVIKECIFVQKVVFLPKKNKIYVEKSHKDRI